MSDPIFQVSNSYIDNTDPNNPITVSTYYPNEKYVITPFLDNGVFDWTTNFNPTYPYIWRHFLNHHKNPLKQIINQSKSEFNNYITLGGDTNNGINQANYPTRVTTNNGTYLENVNVITFGAPNQATITFNAAALRTNYINPHSFYFFEFTDPQTLISNGAILYPYQAFLLPLSLNYVKNADNNRTNGWCLKARIVLLDQKFITLNSTTIEKDAYISHRQRLSSLPDIISITRYSPPNNQLNPIKFKIDLYSSIMRYDYPIYIHKSVTPSSLVNKIDISNDIVFIYPNSTFVTFSADYIDITNTDPTPLNLAQLHQNLDYFKPFQTFDSSFIASLSTTEYKDFNYNTYNDNRNEVFQLIQDLTPNTDISVPLSDIANSIYYVNLGNGANLQPSFKLNVNPDAKIKAVKGSYIGFNYIADCLKMSNLKNKPLATSRNILAPDALNYGEYNNIYQVGDLSLYTQDPPHCFDYKMTLANYTDSSIVDVSNLNFYLKLSANVVGNVATISAYIASDFNALQYGFTPEMYSDMISYQVISTSLSSISNFINNSTCKYGKYPRTPTLYTLSPIVNASTYAVVSATQVPVLSGKDFTIIYNNNDFQNVSCVIKASLKTAAGILDTYEPLLINFNPSTETLQSQIFLNIVNEKSNSITLDSSFNVTSIDWPYVDLSNSNITWDWYNTATSAKDIPVSFNYVDLSGNYIAPVDTTKSVPFSSISNQIVNLSGYGPNLIQITLNSISYDTPPIAYTQSSILTNPSLFNYLDAGAFIVNSITNLDNLNLTRTIKLSAAIQFSNKIYDIPSNIPIYWTWTYGDSTDIDSMPITVNQILNNNNEYNYGLSYAASALSSIQVNVTPGYSNTVPSLHKIIVTVHTDIVSPSISGSYSFFVDDFPDPSIFKTDFTTNYYDDIRKTIIANTSNENNIITRPDNSSVYFQFNAYPFNTNIIKCYNYQWTVNDKIPSDATNGSFEYEIDLTNPPSNISPLSKYTSYGYNITATKIGFSLLSATVTNWVSAHNINAYTYLYILENDKFYTPLKFIIYPEYAWLSNDPTHVTLLSSNNFTNSFAPTAYGNKLSNSQTFWVSANKSCFDEYLYQNLNNNEVISALSSYELIDIPYNFNNSLTTVPISLVAYNSSFYAESFVNSSYLIYKNNTLTTENYNLTAQTIDGSATNDVFYNNFFLSPCILPYNNLLLSFTVNQSSIELDNNSNISIVQYLSASGNGPAIILAGSTVTYYLSNQYWTASATVPAINGTYSLFDLKIGDPANILHCGDGINPIDSFNLYAKTNIIQQIPPSTFYNYLTTNQPNLWVTLSGI
jgi:hypothetical protein